MQTKLHMEIFFFCRSSPAFEADYLEIVKDVPTISLTEKKLLSVYGPNAFPVVSQNDGYAYVAAGSHGEVISM